MLGRRASPQDYVGAIIFLSSDADFDLTNPPNTVWESGSIDANAYLNLPSHIDLNLYKLPMFMYRQILHGTLPGKITLGLGASYSDNLNAFIKSVNEGDPFIDNNANLNAVDLGLDVEYFNETKNFDDVKYKWLDIIE